MQENTSPLEDQSVAAAFHALRAENEALQASLNDAEALIHAIHNGEVDGLIVAGDQGQQVFSLQHAEWNYRRLVEEMDQGAALLAEDGAVLWANRRLAEILRLPLESLLGATLGPWLARDNFSAYEEWIATLNYCRQEREFIRIAHNSAPVPLYLTSTPLPPESGAVATLIVTDLTRQREGEALRQAQTQLETANTALRQARLAAMNLMEDAIAARNEAERINTQLKAEIAERQQAEIALRASEERLKLGIQVAGLGLAEIDYHTGLAHLMAETTGLFGLGHRPLAVPRATVHATFHPEDRPELMQRIAECLDPAGLGGFAMEHRVVWPDGQVRWLRVRKRVFFNGEGPSRQPTHAMLAALDVTAEKNALEAVRQSEEFKRAVLDAVSSHVAVLDREGRIVAINASWHQFALENGPAPGQPAPNTEIGADYLAICRRAHGDSADGAQVVHDGIRAVLAGTTHAFHYEYPCHSPDQQRWFILTVTPLGRAQGGVVVSHNDVTIIRRLAEDLRKSERRYRTVADFTYDWEFWVNPEGRFEYLSPSVERILGQPIDPQRITEQELLKRVVHPDDIVFCLAHEQKRMHGRFSGEPSDPRPAGPGAYPDSGADRQRLCRGSPGLPGRWHE